MNWRNSTEQDVSMNWTMTDTALAICVLTCLVGIYLNLAEQWCIRFGHAWRQRPHHLRCIRCLMKATHTDD